MTPFAPPAGGRSGTRTSFNTDFRGAVEIAFQCRRGRTAPRVSLESGTGRAASRGREIQTNKMGTVGSLKSWVANDAAVDRLGTATAPPLMSNAISSSWTSS